MKQTVNHEFPPFYNKDSNILILGSIPSKKSREDGFYYAHPKNRFWSTLAHVFNETVPLSIEEKKDFLTRHKIALWDVLESCTIKGSSDQSIENIVCNDISSLLKKTKITTIFTTGKKATMLYEKYCEEKTGIKTTYLPSTSPANCPKNIEEILFNTYQQIKKDDLKH